MDALNLVQKYMIDNEISYDLMNIGNMMSVEGLQEIKELSKTMIHTIAGANREAANMAAERGAKLSIDIEAKEALEIDPKDEIVSLSRNEIESGTNDELVPHMVAVGACAYAQNIAPNYAPVDASEDDAEDDAENVATISRATHFKYEVKKTFMCDYYKGRYDCVLPIPFKRGFSLEALLMFYCNGVRGDIIRDFYFGGGDLYALFQAFEKGNRYTLEQLIQFPLSIYRHSKPYGAITLHYHGHKLVLARRTEKIRAISKIGLDLDIRRNILRLLFIDLAYLRVD